ncbi:MAG TPA: Gmad2 immunoglobulin-like domain-containing protein, partial [Verrucomicrobiae bacterium]|nr:Gmad2 immunoglobulin-like domain-containing protein [Verrucomicrobiae bacterium]
MNTDEVPTMTDLRIGKMNPFIVAILGVLLIATTGVGVYLWQQETIDKRDTAITSLQAQLAEAQNEAAKPSTANHYTSTKGVSVVIYAPLKDAQVSNPTGIIGEVPGGWSFEAAFPVELQDSTGAVIAHGSAQVLGDWMSPSGLIPFSVKLIYADAPKGTGTIILRKD